MSSFLLHMQWKYVQSARIRYVQHIFLCNLCFNWHLVNVEKNGNLIIVWHFLEDLAVIVGALDQSILSLVLQCHDVTLVVADSLIQRCIRAVNGWEVMKGNMKVLLLQVCSHKPTKTISFVWSWGSVRLPAIQLI